MIAPFANPAGSRVAILGPDGRPAMNYDALDTRGRRRSLTTVNKSEDLVLPSKDRRKINSNIHQLRRSFEMVAWAIRCHLNYVASFEWQSTTADSKLNDYLETWMAQVSTADRFDAAGRHNLKSFIRLMEASRTGQGDVFALKHNDGVVQAIEGDRVTKPTRGREIPPAFRKREFTNGLELDRRGRAINAMVCDRDKNDFANPRVLPMKFMWQLGYFERFDQARGVSPIAAAINRARDVYEGLEYALARAKVEQLFVMLLKRAADESTGDVTGNSDTTVAEDKSSYQVDFGKGPQFLDMDPGDGAEFLTADGPGKNFETFTKFAIMLALKALDIPYSFFDEAHTNFYGSRGGLMQYLKSCESKRDSLSEFLYGWTRWRMATAIRDGELDIGRRDLAEVMGEWRPVGVPWWDPSKEVDGHLKAIAAGLDNPQRIAKTTTGTSWYDNIDQRQAAEKYAAQRGVTVSWTASNQQQIGNHEQGANDA